MSVVSTKSVVPCSVIVTTECGNCCMSKHLAWDSSWSLEYMRSYCVRSRESRIRQSRVVWAYLMTPIAFHGDNQDVVVPRHATFDCKCQFLLLICEQFPSSRVGGVVRESAAACGSQKRAILRNGSIPERPLHSDIHRGYLQVDRFIRTVK